ncbi:hypothetical protein [Pseudoteredinibacter isoporae]|uniref:hypothetical protein n=1 Tax=Pseudoteredinibacter isoporae TaxID=570281 RepID=UPI0031040D3F
MFPLVQHPAEHIARCILDTTSKEHFFCFAFKDEFSASELNNDTQVYSARLFCEAGRYRLALLEGNTAELESLRNAQSLPIDGPWFLQTVSVAKPWGQEIWYSAYEQRGVCHFAANADQEGLPIPVLLHLFPQLLGQSSALNLLKVLAPYSSELLGELYFEMHKEKQEVYVVSHIDKAAWPEGIAKMRFGFCEQKLQQFSNFEQFKQAYLSAVTAYESVRREIDAELQESSSIEAISESEKQGLLSALPVSLQQREADLARNMSSFIAERSLRLGDVIKVPKMLPHGLLHGVRVVEFQTPVYERLILSFRQAVLTQDHWDTEQALSLLAQPPRVEVPPNQNRCSLGEPLTSIVDVERIVSFDDFEVYRVHFLKSGRLALASLMQQLLSEQQSLSNVLLLALHPVSLGNTQSSLTLQAEQGACLPLWQGLTKNGLELEAEKGAIVLLSRPLP